MTTHRGWKLGAKIRPEQEKKSLKGSMYAMQLAKLTFM